MDMDVEYQYETFNGLPVYYGGDLYDSEDSGSEPDVPSDTAGTEPSAVMEGSDIEDCCLWTDLLNEEDCSISNVGLSVDRQ